MSTVIPPTKLQDLSIVELLAVIHVLEMIVDGKYSEVDTLLAEMEA